MNLTGLRELDPILKRHFLEPIAAVPILDGQGRLVDLGYEPSLGARPLKRAILKELQNPLAETLLAGGYGAGTIVKVDVVDEKFTFAKA